MYTLQQSTDLFTSHKAAQVLSDQSAFQALRASNGFALFFGMGDDNILYLNAEQTNVATGWTPVDLTTELAALYPGQTVTGKLFVAGQSAATGGITIAQVIHIAESGNDLLFVMTNLSNEPNASWMQSPVNRHWVARPYDNTANPLATLSLSYVELPVSDDPSQTPFLVAGVIEPVTNFVQTCQVNLTATTGVWTIFPTAEDFDTMLGTAIGKPGPAMFPGLYQLYTLSNEPALTFTPWQSLYGPPDVTKFVVPPGASSISCTNGGSGGATDLYVAASGGVFLYPAASQNNLAAGIQILNDSTIEGAVDLQASIAGKYVVLWGRTNSGVVFYSRCLAGSQQEPSAWSAVMSIATGVDQLATSLDPATGMSSIYAHQSGQAILKLTQDPVTTLWRQTSVLLPALAVSDVVEFYTYTTRILAVDSNSLPIVNQAFTVTSTSPCSVYVGGVYMTLSPSAPLTLTSDVQGSVTITQETTTLGAVCYNVTQGDGTLLNVNPMANTVQRMSGIQNGSQLAAVQVTDEWGKTQPLVSSSIPSGNVNAVAEGIAQFVQSAGNLPPDGSVQTAPASSPLLFDAAADTVWGMKFDDGAIAYYNGPDAVAALGIDCSGGALKRLASYPGAPMENIVESWAGDIYRWLEHAVDKVKQFFVTVADGVTHFFIEIGDALYHFVMQCVNDVVHAIQFVLHAIEVGFDKLVQWVGFIFSWNDILRTHRVLKNIVYQYSQFAISNIGTARTYLQNAFTYAKDALNQWAGMPPVSNNASGYLTSGQGPAGSSTPQANYGNDQAKSNSGSASTGYTAGFGSGSQLEQLLNDFETLFDQAGEQINGAYQNLKTNVIDNLANLSAADILKGLIDFVFNVILDIVEAGALMIVDTIQILVQGVTAVLDAPLDIPVLTWLYGKITDGDPLSILDLCCLIVAIPVTIVAKLLTNQAPFPDDAFTASLIAAPNFQAIQQLYQSGASGALAANYGASSNAILSICANVAAYFGSMGVSFFAFAKRFEPENGPLACFYAGSYLFFVMPDIVGQITATTSNWTVEMNTAICILGITKTFVDISLAWYQEGASSAALTLWNKVSPGVECFINVLWEIPVVGSLVQDQSAGSIIGFLGNTAFDLGGFLAPFTVPVGQPTPNIVFLASLGCNSIYGYLMLFQIPTFLSSDSDPLALPAATA